MKTQTRSSSLFVGLGFLVAYIIIFALVYLRTFQSGDSWLAIRINSSAVQWLTPVMAAATDYGREYFWSAIVALLFIFGKRDTKILAIELALLFVGGIVVGEVLKVAFYRERPFLALSGQINLLTATDTDSSFPSGHAIIVSIGAFFVFSKIRPKSNFIAALLILEAAVVCYSRVYLGAHYPTDVIGGIAIGGAVAYLGLFVLEKHPIEGYIQKFVHIFDTFLRKIKIPEVF